MAERAWVFVPDPHRKHRSGIKIECADCGAQSFFAPNSGGAFPKGAAEARFKRDGWTVGNGPRRDFCPKCTAKRNEKEKGSNVVEIAKPTQPVQQAPRIMSRDDRRLIIAEIKGCWDDEKSRYLDGWHDDRIAQSLGAHVPKGWVKEVREDYFGDSGSNDQFDEFIKRVEASAEDLDRLKKIAISVNDSMGKVQKSLDDLQLLAKDVRRAISR